MNHHPTRVFIKLFLRGLLAVVPLFLSLYAVVWFFYQVENFTGQIIQSVLGEKIYFTGLGLLMGVCMITLAGFLMTNILVQKVHALIEKIISKLPILKTLYFAIDDFMEFFANPDAKEQAKKVVLISLPGQEHIQTIGIVTNENTLSLIPESQSEKIAVYIPMSYQIGGFTIFIPKDQITATNLGVEEAMKLAMTGWVSKKS